MPYSPGMLLLLLAACHPAEGPPPDGPQDDRATGDSAPPSPIDRGDELPAGCDPGTPGPTALTLLAQVKDTETTAGHLDIVDMVHVGGLVYAGGLGGMIPVSVVDPAAPRVLFHDPTVLNRYTHVEPLAGDRAAAVHSDRGLDLYDLGNPELPQVIGSIDVNGWDGLAFVDPLLYVGSRDGALVVVDVTDAAFPWVVSETAGLGEPWEIEGEGDGWLYVADHALGVVPVDISIAGAPVVGVPVPLEGAPYDLVVDGDLLYVAMGSAGVAVLDRSDPARPSLVSTITTGGTAIQVAESGGWVVVADRVGVAVIDARAPAHPIPFTRVDTDQYAMAVALSGRTVFVGDWEWFESWSLDIDLLAPAADPADTTQARVDDLATFRITNRGAGSLGLNGATTSDGTSTVWADSRRLAPGEEAEVRVRGGTGAVTVCVATDDPRRPTLTLEVTDVAPPPVGIVAPDFTLSDTEGAVHTLSAELGRPVFIGFFATW